MPWECAAGSTLLIPSGPIGNHLFVVLNHPKDFEGHAPQSCVSVSVCTIRTTFYDRTVVLEPGNGMHPFVQHPSYVSFRRARIDTAAHLRNLVEGQVAFPRDPVSQTLLKQICEGLQASEQTPNYIKDLLRS